MCSGVWRCVCVIPILGNVNMSRRRVSVKELGHADHQGWLYRKKEGKGFLGMKWKKYWFILKKTSLYWYSSDTVSHSRQSLSHTVTPCCSSCFCCWIGILEGHCDITCSATLLRGLLIHFNMNQPHLHKFLLIVVSLLLFKCPKNENIMPVQN